MDDVLAAIKAAGLSPRSVLHKAILAAAKVVEDGAETNAPGPHIISELAKDAEQGATFAVVNVGPDKAHWHYQFAETGAAPHEIKARKKAKLMFKGRRGTVRTTSVKHTGFPAKPFLRPALSNNKAAATAAAGQVFKNAVELAGK